MRTPRLIDRSEQVAQHQNARISHKPNRLGVRNLCVCFSLFLLVGCQSSRSISGTTGPSRFHFASGERSPTDPIEFAESTVLEESPAESASDTSWSRIFGRFRPGQSASDRDAQPVNELPRTDIEENNDDSSDAPVNFDSGF